MPRPPRIEYPDALYHITSRGNGRASIFHNDDDRQHFLEQLKDNLNTYGCMLYAYVLMENHFHLLLRTPQPNLSRFMQRLVTSYALYLRYKHRKPGHQFQGRFKAKLIESDKYLKVVSRYIHLNPVNTKSMAGLTAKERFRAVEQYRWSSYRGYVSERAKEEFVSYEVLKSFQGGGEDKRRAYRNYVYSAIKKRDEDMVREMLANPYSIGSEEFHKEIEGTLGGRRMGYAQDRDIDLPRPGQRIEEIDRVVAREYGIEVNDLYSRRGRENKTKAVAVELALALTNLNQRQIGEHYGNITSQAVGMNHKKVHNVQVDELLGIIERLKKVLISSNR